MPGVSGHLILNTKGVFNRCAVPELTVKHISKMWEEEKKKFSGAAGEDEEQTAREGEKSLEAMITAKKEARKRRREVMPVEIGKRRKKEVWCVDHGAVWGDAGCAEKNSFIQKGVWQNRGRQLRRDFAK